MNIEYLEKRSAITELALRTLVGIVAMNFPALNDQLYEFEENWKKILNKLDAEFPKVQNETL